jgi:hypothetical protein
MICIFDTNCNTNRKDDIRPLKNQLSSMLLLFLLLCPPNSPEKISWASNQEGNSY